MSRSTGSQPVDRETQVDRDNLTTSQPHAVLGGIVIAAIDNGMGLQGYSAAAKYVVTPLVLLVVVTIDAVARRNTAR